MEDMPLDDSVSDLLRALDRLLAVTQGSPGAVALHSRPDAAAAMGRAGALIAAYLARRVGLPPDAAIAWVRMAHPRLLSANLPSTLLDPMLCGGASVLRRSMSLTGGPQTREQAQGQEIMGGPGAIRRAASLPLLPAAVAAPDVLDLC